MSDEPEALIEFPINFPIKVMGRNDDTFAQHARLLVVKHTNGAAPLREDVRVSKNERFLSVTIEITATSREQLDAIYQTLTDDDRVLMAL